MLLDFMEQMAALQPDRDGAPASFEW